MVQRFLPYARQGAVLVGLGVALCVAAKTVGRWYYDPALSALAGWTVPPDFSYFYLAAERVLSGESPYRIELPEGWHGYVYPPLLAWIVSPLTLLSAPVAAALWAGLSVLCIVAALWIVGVRDWRCYPVALLWPFNREAIEFGTIDGLLVLTVALCWRYRDAPLRASAATGFAVALKLFLVPLVIWLALSGRVRTALYGACAAVLLVLVPWALIGFDDIGRYPDLLREVSSQQQGSYSLAALADELGVPYGLLRLPGLVVGAGLLFLAYRFARLSDADAQTRDARSFILTLTAALALTPVVWNHYFILLVVPVAIVRPRLSGLWFLPLVVTALYLFDWYGPRPEGITPLLAMAAVTAAMTLVAVRDRSTQPAGPLPNAARRATSASSTM